METMSLKRYEFINKVYVKELSATSIVLRIIGSIIMCIILFPVMLPSIFGGSLTIGVGLLVYIGLCIIIVKMIMTSGIKKIGHMQIRTIIDFYSDSLVMRYDYIDREDGMGARSEEYTFYYRDIIDLEFSVPLQCLNIKCGPLLRVHFHRKSREIERDYTSNKRYFRNLIYLPPDQRDEMLKDIQLYSSISIKELH